jgi:hypothetical protein
VSDAVATKAREFIARNPGARSAKVLEAALDHGGITTEELLALGYKHAPRARQDAVDFGFPMDTAFVKDSDGKRIAKYTLLTEVAVRAILNGRAIIPKAFKNKLVDEYGACDRITGLEVVARALQVDHRVPYQVSGDDGLWAEDVTKFMLLTGSSQRKKSFSCEQCPNFLKLKDPAVCGTCYWAFPEAYEHIAMRKVRQVELVWQDEEADRFDRVKARLSAKGMTVEDAAKAYLMSLDQ